MHDHLQLAVFIMNNVFSIATFVCGMQMHLDLLFSDGNSYVRKH